MNDLGTSGHGVSPGGCSTPPYGTPHQKESKVVNVDSRGFVTDFLECRRCRKGFLGLMHHTDTHRDVLCPVCWMDVSVEKISCIIFNP